MEIGFRKSSLFEKLSVGRGSINRILRVRSSGGLYLLLDGGNENTDIG
jgi:hypothetical protein